MKPNDVVFHPGMSLTCPPILFANGLTYGLEHSTLPGKVICGLLAAVSCWSWAVMIAKMRYLRQARTANRNFEAVSQVSAHPLAVFQSGERFDRSPYFHIYSAAARELAFQLVGIDYPDKTFATRMQGAGRITPSQMTAVRRAIERGVEDAVLPYESRLVVLGVALGATPFIGLVGTIWGVLDSFALLAQSSGSSVQAMAPGIAAALVTTVAGLLLALPSMFAYNLLIGHLRATVLKLDNYAGELAAKLDRQFVDHRTKGDELPSLGSLGSPSPPVLAGATTNPPLRARDIISRTPSISST